jgi:CDP-glucose 4,6-dehydratase
MIKRDAKFWQDRPTLVTGGTGLVGAWLVKRLVEARADVTCIIRDWIPQSELASSGALAKVKVVRGDICDEGLVERTLAEHEIKTVMHLAAQTIVPIANRNPLSTFESNIRGTWLILEACRRSPLVQQIIIASSDKAYGDQEKLPYTEATPLQGQHPYDVSKSCADLISNAYAVTYKSPVLITRCGNFYGGGDLNWNRILPGAIRSILRGERPIIRSDGLFIRDYFYVEDGADAYMLLAEALAQKPELAGHAFNFSNEIQVTVLQLLERLRKAMGTNLQPIVQNQATNEIRHQYLSAEKARTMLGWKPLYGLDDGLRKTVDWYRDFLNK